MSRQLAPRVRTLFATRQWPVRAFDPSVLRLLGPTDRPAEARSRRRDVLRLVTHDAMDGCARPTRPGRSPVGGGRLLDPCCLPQATRSRPHPIQLAV